MYPIGYRTILPASGQWPLWSEFGQNPADAEFNRQRRGSGRPAELHSKSSVYAPIAVSKSDGTLHSPSPSSAPTVPQGRGTPREPHCTRAAAARRTGIMQVCQPHHLRPPLSRQRGSGGEKMCRLGVTPRSPVRSKTPRFLAGSQIPRPVARASAPNPARRPRITARRAGGSVANPIALAHQPPAGPGEWGCPPSLYLFFSHLFPRGRGDGGVGAT